MLLFVKYFTRIDNMRTSINLSEWFANEYPQNMIKDKNSEFYNLLPEINAEINQADLLKHAETIKKLNDQGLLITNLRSEFPLLSTDGSEEKSLDLLQKWNIKNLTVIDTSHYVGHDTSINTRLSETIMDKSKWNLFCEKYNKLGALCQSLGIDLMLSNHSGTVLENLVDFDQISENYKYGFCIDVPHFLYVNEKMDQLTAKIESKVTGVRLGSFTACAWVATRQNRYSWNESVRFGIFEPYKTEHKKMLKNFNQMIVNRYHQLKTISLTCERNNELNNPLDNFKSAQAAFAEIIQTQVVK